MNIQTEKANIIEQVKKIEDLNLIHAIKHLLEYGIQNEQENIQVTDAHKKLVRERFDKIRAYPERLMDWEEAKKKLKTK